MAIRELQPEARPVAPSRPRAWEDDAIPWNFRRIPKTWCGAANDEIHPARCSAIFVVHGMGRQGWTETAVSLRSGFEDALEAIREWQRETGNTTPEMASNLLPPPFIFEGYWADYSDLETTFSEDWGLFSERERFLFKALWKRRSASAWRTARWVIRQQLRLLHPRIIRDVSFLSWLLYWPLQVVALFALVMGLLRHREALTDVIADVRLYCTPRGEAEQAIVQRIDYRVGKAFLRLIGLDWDFRPLEDGGRLTASGEPVRFDRVTWVAHSLGTVVSYNVLSDLFARADQIDTNGTLEQREGVERFRRSLRRFVTLGSPLDKIAYLFGETTLRPWPADRRDLLVGGETTTEETLRDAVSDLFQDETEEEGPEEVKEQSAAEDREWWVNFYHVLDPVSGPLESPLICRAQPPTNLHARSGLIPGLAHVAYWGDVRSLRYILGRTFGARFLRDKQFDPLSPGAKLGLAMLSYCVWAALLGAGAVGIVWGLVEYGPELAENGLGAVKSYLLGL